MTSESLERLREERDELIEEHLRASRGRLTLSEARMVAIRDRIDGLNQAIENLEASNAQET